MKEIDILVKEIEDTKGLKLYQENKALFDIVSQYIIDKKLMLYGGLTINLLLPKKKRFYKEYTLNDFDCYSKNALKDSFELSNLLKLKGYKYIKIKKAKHKNTYRIYVKNIQIIDISNINTNIYNKLYHISIKESKKIRYYKNKYIIMPILMIKMNLYYELARPIQSGFRWDKIYSRLLLFSEIYKNISKKVNITDRPLNKDETNIFKKVLNHIKVNNYPIIEEYALNLHINKLFTNTTNNLAYMLVILSKEYEKTKMNIYNIINDNINHSKYSIIIDDYKNNIDLSYSRYSISIYDKVNDKTLKLISIIENNNDCFSIQKKKGYTIGSIDTILYFLYNFNLLNELYDNNKNINIYTSVLINDAEEYISSSLKRPLKRLMTKCYGNTDNSKNDFMNWDKRMTIKYLSL